MMDMENHCESLVAMLSAMVRKISRKFAALGA
jgi:hypothetical protein